jgi:hypothetical protein
VTLTAQLQNLAEAAPGHTDGRYCLVDLDDCALDTSPRSVAILEGFLRELHNGGETDPEVMAERLAVARGILAEGRMPYLARELWQFVAPGTGAQLEDAWFRHWFERFFTNDALLNDCPRTGAVKFLTEMARYFPPVGYLTGRHRANASSRFPSGMQMGTEATLWRHGFPLGPLLMKAQWDREDVAYKESTFRQLLAEGALIPIGYIDNEPGCVLAHHHVMSEAGIPHLSVWFNGVHNTAVELPPEVRVLDSFVTT